MADGKWTWDPRAHSRAIAVLAEPATALEWCGQLEVAAADAVVGKILCVLAAAAVAREVSTTVPGDNSEPETLNLLGAWIDDPTDERFELISALIFDEGQRSAEFGPHGVIWWALRTATSSVGNYEAGWALETACSAAVMAGFSPERLRVIVEGELLSRRRQEG